MRKAIVAGGLIVATVVALRRFAPKVGARLMAKCERMFEQMPEDFPPKRMMRGIDEIRHQNDQILRRLGQPQRLAV